MTRTWTTLRIGLVLIGTGDNPVAAQELRPAVFGAAAVANVYRTEDQSFGTELNVGGGLGIEWKRLGLDAEVHRTLGLTPRGVQCGLVNVPCVGSAREGFLEATMLSGNISYFFGGTRVRPYVTGSVGVFWTENVNSLTIVSSTAANVVRVSRKGHGARPWRRVRRGRAAHPDALAAPGIPNLFVGGNVASESRPTSRSDRRTVSVVDMSRLVA